MFKAVFVHWIILFVFESFIREGFINKQHVVSLFFDLESAYDTTWKNNPGLECSLYVDDFVICIHSRNMDIIERQLQQGLNKLQTWSDENDFKFSKTKTKCMHFCNKRGST